MIIFVLRTISVVFLDYSKRPILFLDDLQSEYLEVAVLKSVCHSAVSFMVIVGSCQFCQLYSDFMTFY